MTTLPSIFTTKAGDHLYYGFIKEHYGHAKTEPVPGGFRMLYPGIKDLAVAVPSEMAKHVKKASDGYRGDEKSAIQHVLLECVGELTENGRHHCVLLDVSEEDEAFLRWEHNITKGGSLGPVLSNSTFNAQVFKLWDPMLTTLARNTNGDTLISFYDYQKTRIANVIIPAAPVVNMI